MYTKVDGIKDVAGIYNEVKVRGHFAVDVRFHSDGTAEAMAGGLEVQDALFIDGHDFEGWFVSLERVPFVVRIGRDMWYEKTNSNSATAKCMEAEFDLTGHFVLDVSCGIGTHELVLVVDDVEALNV